MSTTAKTALTSKNVPPLGKFYLKALIVE